MDQNCAVVSIAGGAPAFRAGMATGDKLIAVNGKPNTGLTHDQVVGSLRGGVGVPVTIAFVRGQKSYQVHLVHEAAAAPSAIIRSRQALAQLLPPVAHQKLHPIRLTTNWSDLKQRQTLPNKWLTL